MKLGSPQDPVEWKSVLAFLPGFDRPGYEAGTFVTDERTKDGTLMFPYWEYREEVLSFVRAVHESGALLEEFDWPAWQERAVSYLESDEVDNADLETCRRLLMTHVRKDRFMDGHLGEMIESGHIVEVLKRIQQILHEPPTPV